MVTSYKSAKERDNCDNLMSPDIVFLLDEGHTSYRDLDLWSWFIKKKTKWRIGLLRSKDVHIRILRKSKASQR